MFGREIKGKSLELNWFVLWILLQTPIFSSSLSFINFSVFPSFSLSSFSRSISFPFSTIFPFYLRITLWLLNYVSQRFMWFFSRDLFSIFSVCFHPFHRIYQPQHSQLLSSVSSLWFWVFSSSSSQYSLLNISHRNFSVRLSIISHNTPIFVFRNSFNPFLLPPVDFITNFYNSFLLICIQIQIKFFFQQSMLSFKIEF